MCTASALFGALFRSLVVLLLIVSGQHVHGQFQNPTFVPVAPEKLSSTFVRCIYKDAMGFMWFGTGNGLVRYDGTDIYKYEHIQGDRKSISDNRINAIVEDAEKNLWIGTAQGLLLYNREQDNFIDVDSIAENTNHLNNRYISALSIDRKGRLWIGTHGSGVNVYDPATFTFSFLVEPASDNSIKLGNYITTFFFADDTMWAGTKNGLKRFNALETKPVSLPVFDESLASKEITQIVQDMVGNMWLATVDGEIIELTADNGNYRIRKTVMNRGLQDAGVGTILALCVDAIGNLWIGGENFGLNYVYAQSHKIVPYEAEEDNPGTIATNSVRSIYIDNTGITWVGTYNKGAYLIDNNAKKFDSFQRKVLTKTGLSGNNVKGLAEDKEGNLWVASDGGGLGKLDLGTNAVVNCDEVNKQLATRHLSGLLYDTKGDLWIATLGQGVYKVNLQTLKVKNYKLESAGFGNNKVFCLHEDKKRKLWAGSAGSGLFYFDKDSDAFKPLLEEKKDHHITKTAYVTSILEDNNDGLWVATLFGLYRLKSTNDNSYEFTLYIKTDLPGGIGSHEIWTIHQDAKKTLWFGTGSNGVALLPDGTSMFKTIQRKDGLLSNLARSILIDEKGNAWIGGNMGLSKYNPATNAFLNYTNEDGLPSNEFNFNACLRATDGKFYFGTENGVVAFYPDSIHANPEIPLVYFTDLRMNNKSVQINAEESPLRRHISLTDSLELPFSQRSFLIDFVGIHYGQSSGNQYCYKLEGFDKDWNCVGATHSATYTNLDPGNYVFLVTTTTSDGISSLVPAKLVIKINQAPWKAWWAILLYILATISFVFFLIRIRLERIKIRNALELERMAREKEHELIESKTQFFTDISHELRTPLSLIFMPLENLISTEKLPTSVKERLGTIQTSAYKMLRLVNELMDFNKLESSKLKLRVQQGELVKFITEIASVFNDEAERSHIHFGVHSMVGSLEGWFDHDKLEKILVNMISNAFKFTSEHGQINVVINTRENKIGERGKIRCLELAIIDNGIGISPEELPFIFDKFYQARSSAKIANPGTGIGLALTKGLVELHHGSITVESAPEQETKFLLLLPIDREVYGDEDISEIQNSGATSVVPNSLANGVSIVSPGEDFDNDKANVLVVEDNEEMRKYISMELRQQFNVLEAKDGREGLEIATERTPDLIVSDLLMPNKTGIELCHEIKSSLKTSHIPFIMLTAKSTVNDQIEGLAIGADVYITKPFSIRFLIAQVNQIIESRAKLYSRFSQDVYLLPVKAANNAIDQAFLQKAIDYVVENLQAPQLGVDSIAELFNLSRMQVYRKIKALTGKSVVEFIRMVRVKQALTLMEMQQYTLSEIAFRTGFNTASYFTRCFKEEYGKAPSEYLESRS
jgi:signal transduction histidine kinase/ligand-binding sensor domain-containing protein/CheY-like chemotaxis protein